MKPQFKAALATILVLCLTALGTGVALGADRTAGGGDFLRTEFEVLGSEASATWQAPFGDLRQIGSDGIGGGGAADSEEMKEPVESGPANTGDKVKAGLMSAVIPGAGQLYNGDKKKGFIMMGIEVGIWGAYFIFDHQGDNRMNSATDWAATYAGTRGDHPDSYWQSVGRYMDSDAFNESLLREARALDEGTPTLLSGSDAWQWVNNDRRIGYAQLRSEGNSAYDRRDFMILFAVVNRAVSIVDAVIGAGHKPNAIETEVLGMNMELEMIPSWNDPAARWTVSRRF